MDLCDSVLIVFCETGLIVTPFLPGDSLLFAAGGIAALGGMDIHLMVALLSLAAILGDALNFTVGKYFGGRLFANPDSKIFRCEYLGKTRRFYEKHGGKTIIIARFVPIVRTFAPSSPVWENALCQIYPLQHHRRLVVGYLVFLRGLFLCQLPRRKNNLGLVMGGIIIVSVLPGIIEIARAKLAAKSER
ncbi:DedA protein [Neisseria gonorrhoeae]|uniref:DedA protein n=1 Tax=Neisseria gonorrhoeae TaxID=485 RepID=A0A378VYH4_NEIGO|nr:DedA protein [Neisseria gonorrhoeae]